jgi:UDP-2-acetamido-2-deoxy-ribo-hexuluronate aminotransferase
MKIPFIDLQTQYHRYQTEIDKAVLSVMDKAAFILGEEVGLLEKALSEYTGSPHAITCANGTDALMLALMAIGAKAGDEIITPSFTFIATAEAAAIFGITVVLCDIEEKSYNLDASQLQDKITDKTIAIIPVSLYGQVPDMKVINTIAEVEGKKRGHKIWVIEDAAQSFGATCYGEESCNLSDIACTSFFPSKPLGCFGDGGAVFTKDKAIADKLLALRVHGQTVRYHHEYVGLNSRLDTIQAAVLLVKLKYFKDELKAREKIAKAYAEGLQNLPLILPTVMPHCTHVYAQYSLRVKHREALAEKLQKAGIPTAVHYPKPIHAQPCFKDLGYKSQDFPISSRVSEEVISLPMSAFVTEEQIQYITQHVTDAVE